MALSDLQVYSETAYSAATEVLDQQIEVFNGASRGTLILSPTAHQGDFSDTAFFANLGDILRRRNPYGDGDIASRSLKHLQDTSVKVAGGTIEMRLDPGQFKWIQQNPEVAGAAFGQQLATQMLADMVNTAIGLGVTAIGQSADVTNDVTAVTGADGKASLVNLLDTASKFGDRAQAIQCWLMHSNVASTIHREALTNGNRLFNYGSVNIWEDGFGRVFIVTDSPALTFTAADSVKYNTLGLTGGAVLVGQNNDFDYATGTQTGHENLRRTWQGEWSVNYGVKGYSWDKATGGKAPTDAALFNAANWKRYATSRKDTAGVVLKSN